jgi:hypothetical protein
VSFEEFAKLMVSLASAPPPPGVPPPAAMQSFGASAAPQGFPPQTLGALPPHLAVTGLGPTFGAMQSTMGVGYGPSQSMLMPGQQTMGMYGAPTLTTSGNPVKVLHLQRVAIGGTYCSPISLRLTCAPLVRTWRRSNECTA